MTRRGRRIGLAVAVVALTAAVAAGGAGARGHHRPKPANFQLVLSLSGQYTYHYTAPGIDDQRFIKFKTDPTIAYNFAGLYPKGKPPKPLRHVFGVTPQISTGLNGSWNMAYSDTNSGDNCQVNGGLAEQQNAPLTGQGDYGSRDYDVVLHFASSGDPFKFTGTETSGDACSTDNPWQDWALNLGIPKDPAAVFDAALTISQAKLRAALKGNRPSIDVHLLPKGHLESTDCGTTPDLGINCVQGLDWTGTVVVRKLKK
jgi:hypothetical protein